MKISELVECLNDIKETNGDLDIYYRQDSVDEWPHVAVSFVKVLGEFKDLPKRVVFYKEAK